MIFSKKCSDIIIIIIKIIGMVVMYLKYGEFSAEFHEEVVEVFRSRVIGPTFVA